MADIKVNGNVLNLSSSEVENRSRSENARSSNFIYVQGHEILTNDQKSQLEAANVEIQEYISNKTYLCRYAPEDLSVIREFDFVRLANVFHTELKTAADLKSAIQDDGPDATFKVDLMLHEGAGMTPAQLGDALVQSNVVGQNDVRVLAQSNKVRVTIKGSDIGQLEEFDDVNRIDEVQTLTLVNNVARKTLGVNMVINGTEYQGANQVVCVCDTGFDKGSTDNSVMHPAFKDRIISLHAIGRPDANQTNDPNGHGTHVCGSVVGDGTCTDEAVGKRIQGTATEAKLIIQSLLNDDGGLSAPDEFTPLLSAAYDEGARIHTNSWGFVWRPARGQLDYDTMATTLDKFVFEHPDMIVCIAAGNDATQPNAGTQQVGSAAGAKNCITVGATVSTRPNDGYKFLAGVTTMRDPKELAPFSSRGPSKEGRVKPDIMSPGVAILSTASRDIPPARLDQLHTNYGPCSDNDWVFLSGTSMATPLIAGCVASLRSAAVGVGIASPSAALIKALLINGSIDISGEFSGQSTPAPPNGLQGFGRAHMTRAIAPLNGSPGCGYVDAGEGKAVGSLTPNNRKWQSEPFKVDKTDCALVATLAYTDREGGLLQNDLNLIVRDAQGNERHGNSSGTGYDTQNNVEKVIWQNAGAGPFTVTVEAVGGFTRFNDPQGFAVVWAIL